MATHNVQIKPDILGHPSQLFVLFFTEMWERFSYYGMRALLVLFLVSALGLGGWNWTREEALALYGTYTGLVYLTPILGGWLADKKIGYRNAVVIGAILMTLGHASMALEFHKMFLFIGLAFLIIGNGFFKPNMTSIISEMYKDMGVNAGAFLGIMMCGYLGEKVGWSYGFGLAGIFMLLGMIQFYLAKPLFGTIGDKPNFTHSNDTFSSDGPLEFEGDKYNPFTSFDKILIAIATIMGLVWIFNDPMSKIADTNILSVGGNDFSNYWILTAVIVFFGLVISRLVRYPKITRDRMIAIIIFCVFTVLFWASFEQAGGSMTIFAKDYTNRVMSGSWATIFLVLNILITVVPVLIITYVLYLLFKKTYGRISLSNIVLGFSFLIIWVIIIWMINRDLKSNSYILEFQNAGQSQTTKIIEPLDMSTGDQVLLMDVDKKGNFKYMSPDKVDAIRAKGEGSSLVTATVQQKQENELEIPATWFLILNSLFIIIFAPLFSKWWESKYNPSASVKYGLGLILLGVGFAALAFGSAGIKQGAATASVSLIWLVLAYLFHTLGELCLSPVSLSYISKLVPGRMIAMMFGIYYIAIAIGNKLAGKMGGMIDEITAQYDMKTFFLIFTLVPIVFGLIAVFISPIVKRLMHGVE